MISQISYFFCFSKASCRYLIYQCDQFVFFHPLVHFCVNGTAGNSIDLDVAWAQFFGKSTGQSVDAAFGCTPDLVVCIVAPPSCSCVTSSPVTVFTTFGPVRNIFEEPFFMMMKSVSAGE